MSCSSLHYSHVQTVLQPYCSPYGAEYCTGGVFGRQLGLSTPQSLRCYPMLFARELRRSRAKNPPKLPRVSATLGQALQHPAPAHNPHHVAGPRVATEGDDGGGGKDKQPRVPTPPTWFQVVSFAALFLGTLLACIYGSRILSVPPTVAVGGFYFILGGALLVPLQAPSIRQVSHLTAIFIKECVAALVGPGEIFSCPECFSGCLRGGANP